MCGAGRPPRAAQQWSDAVAAARAELGEAAFDAAWAEGWTWELEQAMRRALTKATAPPVTA